MNMVLRWYIGYDLDESIPIRSIYKMNIEALIHAAGQNIKQLLKFRWSF